MKSSLLFLLVAALAALISCSSRTYPGSTPYPTYPSTGGRNDRVIILDDGRVIDRNGRVVGNTRNLPPGQAKKIYGSKSAKRYSKGHQKKRDYYEDRNYSYNKRYERAEKRKHKGRGKYKHDKD